MNPAGQAAAAQPGPVTDHLALIQEDLERVERLLHESLKSDSAPVQDMVEHISGFGGKRLRPALVLLSGHAGGKVSDDHVKLGVIVELIHLATLLHDDVLDHSSTRRQLPTLNSVAGNRLPILLGDVVYAHAFALSNELEDRTASRYLAGTTLNLCVGEIEQNASRGRLDLTRAEYDRIIRLKTSTLYEASAWLGAWYAGADQACADALATYGRELGIAFQIIDDCLDLVGDERRVGKSLGTDLDEQKLTLPLIRMVEGLDEGDRARLKQLLEDPTVKDRRRVLARTFPLEPALEYARQEARDRQAKAREALHGLPDTPARQVLDEVAGYVLIRDR